MLRRVGAEDELGFGINEFADEPRRIDSVNFRAGPREPGFADELFRGQWRRGLRSGAPQTRGAFQGHLRVRRPRTVEEVDLSNVLELAGQPLQTT